MPGNLKPSDDSSVSQRKKEKEEEEEEVMPGWSTARSVDVSAHREVYEDEDVEFDEDGEREEDGVEDEASQTQSPVQSPFVQMDAENLQTEEKRPESTSATHL